MISRQEHVEQAEVLRDRAHREVDYTDQDYADLGVAYARAMALAQLATSHEAAVARLDGDEFRVGLVREGLLDGSKLPQAARSAILNNLTALGPFRHEAKRLASYGESPSEAASAVEGAAQLLARLLDELDARGLFEKDS